MNRMKFLYALAIWLINAFTAWLADVAGYEALGLFGWALSGATVYMLFEIISNIQRPAAHRFYLVLIGLFMGMAFGPPIAAYWNLNEVAITSAVSLFGYVVLGPLKDAIIKYITRKAEALTKEDADPPKL